MRFPGIGAVPYIAEWVTPVLEAMHRVSLEGDCFSLRKRLHPLDFREVVPWVNWSGTAWDQLHCSLEMTDSRPARRYRFGTFEADAVTGELRRQGLRVKLNAQPFQVLCLLLERHGELLTREEISQELWPDGTFVDFEHGVNSAINRIREALGDTAASPRFVETLARRGYRFLAPVERINLQKDSPHNEPRDDEGRVPG